MDALDLLDSEDSFGEAPEQNQPVRTVAQLVGAGIESIKSLARKAGISRTVIRRQLQDQGGVSLNNAVKIVDAVGDVSFEVGGRLYQVVLVDSQGVGEDTLAHQFDDSFVVARIDHECSLCCNDIVAGEEYRKRVYIDDGGNIALHRLL